MDLKRAHLVTAIIFEHTGRKPEDFYRYSSSTRRDLRKQARAAMNGGAPMKRPSNVVERDHG